MIYMWRIHGYTSKRHLTTMNMNKKLDCRTTAAMLYADCARQSYVRGSRINQSSGPLLVVPAM